MMLKLIRKKIVLISFKMLVNLIIELKKEERKTKILTKKLYNI